MSYPYVLSSRDTVSIAVSGPSTTLAYLRALARRLQGAGTWLVLHARRAISRVTRLPGSVGTAVLTALSTSVGYDTVIGLLEGASCMVARGVVTSVRLAGRLIEAGAQRLARAVRLVAPGLADRIDGLVAMSGQAVRSHASAAGRRVAEGSAILSSLIRTSLVRAVTTRAASIASATIAVHVLSSGLVAARIVRAIPASMTAVVWITNPWIAVAGVGLAMLGASIFAAVRLAQVPPLDPDTRTASAAASGHVDAETAELERMLSGLRVAVGVDGSVTVHGVPPYLGDADRADIAAVAARAATERLRRLVRRGRPLSSADKRSATAAARDAAVRHLTVQPAAA